VSPDRQLRVLLVPSAYYPHVGGIEELTRRLALELERLGHEALVLTNRWPEGVCAEELLDGVRVRRLRFELPAASPRALLRFGVRAPLSAASLLRLRRSFRPDLVHAIGAGPNAAYLAALRARLGAPLVLTAQGEFGGDPHRAFERSRSLRGGLSRLLRRGSAVTACSSFVLDELARVFRVDAPATVIPNGVAPSEFDVPRPHVNGLGRYVFAAGRLVEQKAFDTLLRGFARAELGGRRLVVAGDGPERPALERLAGELAVDVSFVGAVGRARLVELMRGADLFAFSSRYEAFGIALLEAMAAATPAVATRVGGIPEFASDGENALLVPPDDPEALAAALTRLASDGALRERLVSGGRARAEELSWERIAPRYVALYRQVARA
jgi:glycosyltransferase involved in cell wall biosynthesis